MVQNSQRQIEQQWKESDKQRDELMQILSHQSEQLKQPLKC